MPSYTLVDSGMTYRLEAPTPETAVRMWATEALGGSVVVGPVGPSQYMAAQMAPVGRGEFVLVDVMPGDAPKRAARRRGRPSALMARAA